MWNLPTANDAPIAAKCCGPSFSKRPASLADDPIVKVPAGTTNISGHLSHSLNAFFGLSAHSSISDNGRGARDDQETVMGTPSHGLFTSTCNRVELTRDPGLR